MCSTDHCSGNSPSPPQDQTVREQAEGPLKEVPKETLGPEEIRSLVDELRANRIELAMQKEELCRARKDLEALRQRHLYDLAPAGYLTMRRDGTILDTNLAASMLSDT